MLLRVHIICVPGTGTISDRGSKLILVLAAQICASTLGTSGLKGLYLLSLVTNMWLENDFILNLIKKNCQFPALDSYAATQQGLEAKRTFLESKPPAASELRRMRLLPKSNTPLITLGHSPLLLETSATHVHIHRQHLDL